jgi:hypothetical protein
MVGALRNHSQSEVVLYVLCVCDWDPHLEPQLGASVHSPCTHAAPHAKQPPQNRQPTSKPTWFTPCNRSEHCRLGKGRMQSSMRHRQTCFYNSCTTIQKRLLPHFLKHTIQKRLLLLHFCKTTQKRPFEIVHGVLPSTSSSHLQVLIVLCVLPSASSALFLPQLSLSLSRATRKQHAPRPELCRQATPASGRLWSGGSTGSKCATL